MGKIISIFNQKGGVGKTTTNINLSAYIALEGKKVLTVDIDPQGNTTSGLGVEKSKLKKSIYDAMINKDYDELIIDTKIDNLKLLPSNVELSGAEIELTNVDNRENRLKDFLSKFKKDYDYIFIDCPPSLGLLTINALCASDSVIIPIQCEFYALEGVSQLMNTIQLVRRSINKRLQIEGVVMSMFDGRTNLSIEVVEEVKHYFKDKVYRTIVPRNVRLAEAPSHGLPIMLYDKASKGAEAYSELAKEFLSSEEDV